MGYEIVDTPEARFVVILQAHGVGPFRQRVKLPHIQMDAMVVEGVYSEALEKGSFSPQKNRLPIFEKQKRGEMDVFNGDVPVEFTSIKRALAGIMIFSYPGSYLSWQKAGVTILGTIFGIHLIEGQGKLGKRKYLGRALSTVSRHVFGPTITSFRDAIVAEKAISQIAPIVQGRIGRIPTIGISFGSGHYGIVTMLKNPKKRAREISKIRPGLRKTNLFEVYEYKLATDGEKWRATKVGSIQPPRFKAPLKRIRAKVRLARLKLRRWFRSGK